MTNKEQFKWKILVPIRYAATLEFKGVLPPEPDAEGKEACNEKEKKKRLPNLVEVAKIICKTLTQKFTKQNESVEKSKPKEKKVSMLRHPIKYMKALKNRSTASDKTQDESTVKPIIENNSNSMLNQITVRMNEAYESYES